MSTEHEKHEKEIDLIVNGRPRKVPEKDITFEDIVALAFDPVPANSFFTVMWSHGQDGGSLTAGRSVPVRNGMNFDVTETGQS